MRFASIPMRRAERGFSIIELAIVITVLLIIIAVIVPGYRNVVRKAKEDVLADDLRSMRKMIDQFTKDKEHAPHDLQDIVDAHYLHEIPEDPTTGEADWDVELEDESIAVDGDRGIIDVHSKNDEYDSSGTKRYSEW